VQARDALVSALEALPESVFALSDDEVQSLDDSTRSLLRLHPQLTRLRVLEVAAVVSPNHNDPESWRQWSDKEKQQALIERFKRRWAPEKATKTDPLAILVFNKMLLTGFDAPVEQMMNLDRKKVNFVALFHDLSLGGPQRARIVVGRWLAAWPRRARDGRPTAGWVSAVRWGNCWRSTLRRSPWHRSTGRRTC